MGDLFCTWALTKANAKQVKLSPKHKMKLACGDDDRIAMLYLQTLFLSDSYLIICHVFLDCVQPMYRSTNY